MRLAGKVAFITGAASGQGREAAVLFARDGAKVVVTDVNEEGLKETVEMVRSAGGEAAGRQVDVTDAAQVQEVVALAVRSFGALNVLYNNAGVYLRGKDGPVTRLAEDLWDTVLTVNLKSMYLCCKHAIPEMRKAGLRLDLAEWAMKKRPGHRDAIVPGHPEKSELIKRIESTDSSSSCDQSYSRISIAHIHMSI